ncbi:transposase [Methylobacterium sp. Leaf87]|uniref:transposase n=1 Tax=Methylobacterium sp. Leaf87 TaxID=1736243 RepID=UPI00138EDBD4|nr:transposase [Methylobacterium sp. Leaf87]
MADTAGRVRELEFDLETVLATARERDDRCLLRGAGRTEPHRRLRADVRLDGGPGPRLGGRCKGGQQDQALGRSRGGFSTKIHLKTDFSGLPLAFVLTGGEAGDSPQFETLLDLGPDVRPRAAVTDKGYDSKRNRAAARVRGIAPIIPYKANAKKRPVFFPKVRLR